MTLLLLSSSVQIDTNTWTRGAWYGVKLLVSGFDLIFLYENHSTFQNDDGVENPTG